MIKELSYTIYYYKAQQQYLVPEEPGRKQSADRRAKACSRWIPWSLVEWTPASVPPALAVPEPVLADRYPTEPVPTGVVYGLPPPVDQALPLY